MPATRTVTENMRPTRLALPVVAWRAVIAALAWWGLLAALHGDITQLRYFSQVTTLTVALTATASVLTFAVTSPTWATVLAWCRGASTTYAIVTAVIYQVLLSGNLEATSSLLEHAVVPALAVIDWVVFGPGRVRQRWWTALSWLILPICYLGVYYNVRDRNGKPLYPFLNPDATSFWRWVGIMIVVFIVVGFIVWAIGRRGRRGPEHGCPHDSGAPGVGQKILLASALANAATRRFSCRRPTN